MKKIKEKHVKKTNKTMLMIFIVVTIMILTTVAVQAYFTARYTKTNTIKLGYNKIDLNEEYNPPLEMSKGIEFTKKPYVTNTGDVDCYVRVKSVVSDSRIEKDLTIDYKNNESDYEGENDYWVEKDGYWYYQKAIKPGESTKPLFTKVKISNDAEDIVLEGFDIYVYAESVQTLQNEEGKEIDMYEIWNRFEYKT